MKTYSEIKKWLEEDPRGIECIRMIESRGFDIEGHPPLCAKCGKTISTKRPAFECEACCSALTDETACFNVDNEEEGPGLWLVSGYGFNILKKIKIQ